MEGFYTGVGSDVEVSPAAGSGYGSSPTPGSQGSPCGNRPKLYDLVMTHAQIDVPLTLADVRGDL